MDRLVAGEYLRETASLPFAWGQNDCALWCAGFVKARTGIDPAEDLRGAYHDFRTCRNLLIARGGLPRLIAGFMAGFEPWISGDGVCVARANGQVICGILTGDLLAIKTVDGVQLNNKFDILDAWAV